MLTPRQNFLETIKGGNPDRFVKLYEAIAQPYMDPFNATNPMPYEPGAEDTVDYWGVSWKWPEGTPGPFPVDIAGQHVIEDVTQWKSVLHAPPLEYDEVLWRAAEEDYASFDREEQLVGITMFPGLFENCHNLMGMENVMIALYDEPEAMHELIDYLVDWETAYIRQVGARLHPDYVLHHDDWGSSLSTFMSVDMFKEFFLEPYKRLYKTYKDSGIHLIIHHSDSYAATYVPMMIEMGIDVWQGGTIKNDIPKLVKQYGGQISFMTGIDSNIYDRPDWNPEEIAKAVENCCTQCGTRYFIPCTTMEAAGSIYEGVYDTAAAEIDKMSKAMFS